MAKILIIDDDKMICEVLSAVIKREGHEVDFALSLASGMGMVHSSDYDVVFLDVRLPDGSGLDALKDIQEMLVRPEVIIITGEGDPDGAELAIRSGAWDYIEKPLSKDKIVLPFLRAVQFREEKNRKRPLVALKRDRIVGDSQEINDCLDIVAQAAGNDVNTLIIGETGTGKELFANAIHENSTRKDHNFVVVDCAALPETLVESTLFGHEKGSFTGADKSQDGLIKLADGGTLFLDEVGELPLTIQKNFLRVLQERRFRPVGSKVEQMSNFRLVAATNKNLQEMVDKGKFRQDLLFRLKTVNIDIPPLRARGNDIKELAIYFMNMFCDRYNISIKGLSQQLVDALLVYSWPGNVRELSNTMENMIASAGNAPVLFPDHLPTNIRAQIVRSSIKRKDETDLKPKHVIQDENTIDNFKDFRNLAISKAERAYLEKLMAITNWHVKTACEISRLSQSRLYALLKKYNISKK